MKKTLALLCSLMIFAGAVMTNTGAVPAKAQYTRTELESAISSAASWTKSNSNPLSNIGADASDIAITALKRAGIDYDYHAYLDGLDAVAAGYSDGDAATAVQRSLMTVSALGGDTGYFGGRDLAGDATYYRDLSSAEDYSGALMALNAGDIEIPVDTGLDREDYIRNLLSYQQRDGSFGDIRTTAMAIIALSDNYTDVEYSITYADGRGGAQATCQQAIDDAAEYLSSQQSEAGDFYSLTDTAMVSFAMDALGVSQNDERFVKDGNTVIDGLLTYQTSDGGFSEDYNGANALATAYALSAMVSNARALQKKAEFFDFGSNDTITLSSSGTTSSATRATSAPRSSSTARSTTRPVSTTRPSSTTKPRSTTAPRSTSGPSASPVASNAPKITPSPTKKPDLVGPVQIVGPVPEHTQMPELDIDGDETERGNIAIPIVIGIIGVLAAAAAVLVFMAKKKLWIFKKPEKNDDIYHANQHRKTEEERHYEERRKFENRRKYAARGKYKNRK